MPGFQTCLISLLVIALCHTDLHAAASIIKLKAGGKVIKAEVAASPDSREYGLKYRDSLPADHGLLFVFPNTAEHCMWMRDTRIPLSVAFLDEQGTIINIANMQPGNDDYYCASKPAAFALELNLGWFQKHHVAPGVVVKGLEKAPPGR